MSDQKQQYDELLRFKCLKGMQDRGLPQTEEYLQRLDYELKIVSEMDYSPYFLICADLCRFMRERQILFNVRGSGCGSVAVWALGITHKWLDPIKLQLPFERFLNPDRVSNPDLDIDIVDTKRHEVVDYTIEKYGEDKVAHIITFGTEGAKMAIQDVARALQDQLAGDYQEIANRISGAIPAGKSLDEAIEESEFLREQQALYPKLFEFARRVEGKVRHASIHAAGVIICPTPMTDYMPGYYAGSPGNRKPEEWEPTTQWDMYDVEDRGLLKMDYLGLKTLRVIDQTVGAINALKAHWGHPDRLDPFLENIPKDCPKTWELIGNGHLSGVFQIERQFVRNFARRMNLQQTRDLMQLPVLVSIIRPGMMDAAIGPAGESATEVYLQRTEGRAPVEPLHPLTEKVLQDTYQLMVFQEDTMWVSQAMAGMSLPEADTLRRGIGKKKADVVAKMKPVFIEGAVNNGATKEEAEYVWGQMETFARYGFCRGHAAAYGYVTSYQTAWLKANWPLPFMTFLVNSEAGGTSKEMGYNYKVAEYIEEARRMGLGIEPPCVRRSGYQCSLDPSENSIRFGLNLIKGVSSAACEWIIRNDPDAPRQATDFKDFILRCYEHREVEVEKPKSGTERVIKHYAKVRKNDLQSLIDAGAFDIFDPDRDRLHAMLPELLKLTAKWHEQTCKLKSGKGKRIRLTPEDLKQEIDDLIVDDHSYPQRTLEQRLEAERDVTGCFLSESPFEPFKQQIHAQPTLAHASEVAEGDYDDWVVFPAILKDFREITIKKGRNQGKPMAFLRWQGTGSDVETVCFTSAWEPMAEREGFLEKGKVYLVEVRKDRDDVSSICNRVKRLSAGVGVEEIWGTRAA